MLKLVYKVLEHKAVRLYQKQQCKNDTAISEQSATTQHDRCTLVLGFISFIFKNVIRT